MTPTQHRLYPKAPFDFGKSLEFIGEFSPSLDEQDTRHQALVKAVRVQGNTVVFRVTSLGSLENPELEVELYSAQPLPEHLIQVALERVSFYLSLEDDLAPFYALAPQDEPFQQVIKALYGYHQVKFLTPFENAAWAILTQRTSTPVARTFKERLTQRYGSSLETPYGRFSAFPEPADLLNAQAGELAVLTGGFRRNEYLLSAAGAFAGADEAWLPSAPYAEVYRWLRKIKGIGEWSAAFVLLRGLGRMERAILEDGNNPYVQTVLRQAQKVYGYLTLGELRAKAAQYGDWQGYWAHYLRALG